MKLMMTGLLVLLAVPAVHAQDAAAGKAKYDTYCTSCHGPKGKGDGVAAAAMNPKPRDLTASTRTDVELKKIVKEGGAAVGMTPTMPAWGAVLNDADIANVVAYVRQLEKEATGAPAAAPAPAAPAPAAPAPAAPAK